MSKAEIEVFEALWIRIFVLARGGNEMLTVIAVILFPIMVLFQVMKMTK